MYRACRQFAESNAPLSALTLQSPTLTLRNGKEFAALRSIPFFSGSGQSSACTQ